MPSANQIFGQTFNNSTTHDHNYLTVDDFGSITAGIDHRRINSDAGGRVRVSQFTSLFDGKVVNGHTPLILEEAGTGTFTNANSKTLMEVAANEWCVYQSKRFYPYFAGKSHVVEGTVDGFAPGADLEKRLGYFSSNAVSPYASTYDGFYIESANGTITFKCKRAGTTTLEADITEWTGYDLLGDYQTLSTWDNFTVIMFDFLWLGGATIRLWIKTATGFVLAHEFEYAGTATDVFILCPCQPIRYEIRSTGGVGSMRYICSQISTEGSFQEDGIVRAVDTGTAPISLTSAGTTYPLIAIRKQSAYRGVASRLADFNVFVTSANDRLRWSIQINPTLSAPLTYSNVTSSSIQSALGNGTITVTSPGIQMASGHISTNGAMPTGILESNFLAYMGGTLANTMDEYVLCADPLTGSSNVNTFASLAYKEY